MQKTTVNPNPEQEMTVNPFAQEQAAEIQPQENAQTYPSRNIPMSVPRTFRSRYGSGRSRKARSCPRTASGRLPN